MVQGPRASSSRVWATSVWSTIGVLFLAFWSSSQSHATTFRLQWPSGSVSVTNRKGSRRWVLKDTSYSVS